MESVKGHLSGWLAHALGSNAANHLTWVDQTSIKSLLDLAYDEVKRLLVEAMSLNDVLSAKHRAKVHLEQPGGVLVGLIEDWALLDLILRVHLELLFAKVFDFVYHVLGV